MERTVTRSASWRLLGLAQDGFFLWVVLGALWGYWQPELVRVGKPFIAEMIGCIMLGMGLTLTREELARLPHSGRALGLGVLAQFVCMPIVGWMLALVSGLPPELGLGVILVGAAPGGTASNVITFLARGDVALSVGMTVVSTLLCIVLTPAWVWLLGSTWVPIDPLALLGSIAKIVLGPVLVGVVARWFWTPRRWILDGALPLLSMIIIAAVVGIIVASNRGQLQMSAVVLLVVVLHCSLGFALGILGTRRWVRSERQRTTIGIEVGMQNSGLAVALAVTHFGPLAAVPGALFSVWQNVFGAAFAAYSRRRSRDGSQEFGSCGPSREGGTGR
jgi:BASS family bile acid:Na+ symporter